MSNKPTSILFDLDGTLLDTHLDMCAALNQVLENHDKAPMSPAVLRPFVSKGSMVMVCLAFRCRPGSDESKTLWQEMIEAYALNIAEHTCLFPGMDDVLEKIESDGNKWGIVTNKPGHLTALLLQALSLPFVPQSVVSGDTLPVKKPDPAPLLLACEELGDIPGNTLYVGDDERDIIAGKAAGMRTVAAEYGYIVHEENPQQWGADGSIARAGELLLWIS